jgi:DNA polymerase-3 subunit beta
MDGEFDMEGMAGKIRVTEKRGSVDLWCVDPLEFPVPPSFGDKFQFLEVDAKDLTRALKCGLATASRDESRYILNGVALERKQVAPLEVVATDGRRLAHCAMCISAADFVGCKVVPVAGVQVLSSLAGQLGEAECRLELTENLLRMQLVKGGSYVCKLLEGTFPNWRQVVPEMKGEPVALNVDEILAAINVSQWFGDSVSLTSRGGSLAVAARDAETGRSEWSLPLDLGDGFRRTFDQGFLSEGLAMMQGETKAWFGEEEGSAAVFTDTFAQYVLMPMRSADVQEGEG